MELAGGLWTIAQLAMTLTGFAGLLIGFRMRRSRWHKVEIFAIRFLFKSSVGALVFALAPLPMMLDETAVPIPWALLFALMGCWNLAMVFGAFRDRRRGDLRPRYELGYWGLTLSGLVVSVVLLAGAAGQLGLQRPSIYMLGLYWLLAVATFQLIMQVFASIGSIDAD